MFFHKKPFFIEKKKQFFLSIYMYIITFYIFSIEAIFIYESRACIFRIKSQIGRANFVAILRMSRDIASTSNQKTAGERRALENETMVARSHLAERHDGEKGKRSGSRNYVVLLRTANTPALSEADMVVIVEFFSCRQNISRGYSRGQGGCGQDFNVPKCRNVIRMNVSRARFVHPVNDHLATAFLRRRDYIFLAY